MGYVGRILIVFGNVRHVSTQNSVVILRFVEHVDQIDVEVVGKVHVGIRLHAKILHLDWLKVQLVRPVLVDVIPMDHGRQPAPRPSRSLGLARIHGNDPNLILVFLAVGIIFVAVQIPAPGIVFQVTVRLGLFDDPKDQPLWILRVLQGIVEGSGTQFITIGSNQQVDGNVFRNYWIGVVHVVIVRAIVGRRANSIRHVGFTCVLFVVDAMPYQGGRKQH
jgi:hypothetical protein